MITDRSPLEMNPQELRAYALAGGNLAEVFERDGVRGEPVEGPVPNALDVPMRLKSLRLPLGMVEALEEHKHPEGMSGIIREAVDEWLQRHGTPTAQLNDARRALETLTRVINSRAAGRAADFWGADVADPEVMKDARR